MIVIASHNGNNLLKNLVRDIQQFGTIPNEEICVVDNLSNNEKHLEYLKELKESGCNVLYNDRSTYEWGAFKYAIDRLKAPEWFCLQDSIRIHEDIFSLIKPKLTTKNVWTVWDFEMAHDDGEYRKGEIDRWGTHIYQKGIFASMLFAKNEIFQKYKHYWPIEEGKFGSQMIQRGMAIILERHGIKINSIDHYDHTRSFKLPEEGGFSYITKLAGGRG